MFSLFKKTPKKYTKWEIISMTESLGWVTITQIREELNTGLKEFKNTKIWINCCPKQFQEMFDRLIKENRNKPN